MEQGHGELDRRAFARKNECASRLESRGLNMMGQGLVLVVTFLVEDCLSACRGMRPQQVRNHEDVCLWLAKHRRRRAHDCEGCARAYREHNQADGCRC